MHPVKLLAVALALAASLAEAEPRPVVSGEPARAPAPVEAARLRLGPVEGAAPRGPRYRLPAVPGELVADLRSRNQRGRQKRLAIGASREVPSPGSTAPVAWTAVDGGFAARTALTSPEAGSLRLALDLAGIPEDVEMVFAGSADPGRLEGPVRVGDVPDRSVPYWTPLTEGETQTVEIFVPARDDPATIAPRIVAASHVFTTPSSGLAKLLADIGRAGACNVDVACSTLNGSATFGTAFRNAAAATAQMVITDGGVTYKCSGALVNDTDPSSQQPWFFSANHCLDNEQAPFKTRTQMQAVANTMQTAWFFDATACRSAVANPNWALLSGGATIFYQNADDDALFVRLNRAPPAGAFYAGWDANPVNTGSDVITLHHPSADLKKVSQGTIKGYASLTVGNAASSFIEMAWTSGTTEAGSSGSGFFTWNGLEYLLRGGEYGGFASCTNLTGADYYSRFDLVWPSLQPYLAPSATPFADVTDLWWGGASESGWGLNLVQHASGVVFAVWYTYESDGTRTWFVMPTGTWTDAHAYSGTIYWTAGPAANGAFNPALVRTTAVGSGTLAFTDASNGTFAYTINGVSGTKAITRQPY